MSTQPSPGWTDARARRARMFAMLLAACAAVGLWATFQPWFAWATPGLVPGCEPAPPGSPTITIRSADGVPIAGIAARGCVTGAQTVESSVSPVGTPAGVSAAAASLTGRFDRGLPDELLGLPRSATVLVSMTVLALLGVVTRRGYLPVIAVLALQVSHQDLATTRGLFLGGVSTELTATQPGLVWFTWALLASTALSAVAAVFVLRVNYLQRVADRSAARERGEDEPAEPLDPLTGYLGRKIGKIRVAAAEHARASASA